MKISNDVKLDFDDVLIVPNRSKSASRKNVVLSRLFKFYHSNRTWEGLPVMVANMDTTGTFEMANSTSEYQTITCLHKHYWRELLLKFFQESVSTENLKYIWLSVGIKDHDLELLKYLKSNLLKSEMPNLCIDVANGYTDDFVQTCLKIRDIVGYSSIIMAGNICTPEMIQELILHGGVDIVKVGIGPGSGCTTRLKTGIGYPQLSSIIECSSAAHGLKSGDKRMGLICADGGCKIPADICKAFSAGSDFVMCGGIFAGTEECDGEWKYHYRHKEHKHIIEFPSYHHAQWYEPIKHSLKFYGMSSHHAQSKNGGKIKDYRSSEGRMVEIPYKGEASTIIQDICGSLRSCCAYTGANCLKDLSKTARFVRVNRTHYNGVL
jgi:GMP reductase